MNNHPKVLVLGLDGGTWNVIKPLVEQGKLPTIAKLMRNGCYGDLESCIPPITFPAWKCYSTGKNPGKLGVFGFVRVNTSESTIETPVSSSLFFKSREIWDYLGDSGVLCGVINMPTTYPPKKIRGFMISHYLIETQGYTYPKTLEKELVEKFNYRLTPENLYMTDSEKTIEDCKKLILKRFEVAEYLIENFNPKFLHLTIFYIDHIQHYYWKFMTNSENVIKDFYILIDNKLKDILAKFCNENTYIFIMSDHGFAPLRYEFNIAKWLIDNGLLVISSKLNMYKLLLRLNISTETIVKFCKSIRIYDFLRRAIPAKIQLKLYESLPSKRKGVGVRSAVDWNKSKVLAFEGQIYINTKLLPRHSEEYNDLRRSLIDKLKNMRGPDGKLVFRGVYTKDEVYSGDFLDYAPDVVLVPNEGYMCVSKLALSEWLTPQWSAHHQPYGIFIAYGPDVKKGCEVEGVRIYDIAPTILHLYGLPIPRDMDGRVLEEIFEEGSEMARRPIMYRDVESEKSKIREKIMLLKKEGRI